MMVEIYRKWLRSNDCRRSTIVWEEPAWHLTSEWEVSNEVEVVFIIVMMEE